MAGLLAPIQEALSDFAKAVIPPASASAPNRGLVAGAESILASIPELKETSDNLLRALEKLEQDTLALGARCENLDEVIAFLEKSERGVKEALEPEIIRAKAKRGNVFSNSGLSRQERALVIGAPQRFERILTATLERLRDTRWRLMAARAEFGEKGDAPVFDDPDLLFKYLDDHTR